MANEWDVRRPGYLPAVLLFTLGTLILAFPWLSGRVTIPWDAKAEFYPQLVFLARSIHSGEWPFWAPNVFGGQPQIADPQSLIFSPPFLILAALNPLPNFQAADAAVFATLFMGGLAILMFFRDRGWHPAGGLLAAFAFSFGGSNAWRIQHVGQVMSLCWFAVALWLLARALQRRSFLWGILAGFAAGLMIIGRDQVALLCALILAGYVLVTLFEGGRFWRNIPGMLKPLTSAAIVGLATIAVPVLMTAVFASQSNRPAITYEDAVAASLHPAGFFTLISADLFGTAGPMAKYWGPPTPEVWGGMLALARNMADIYLGALPVVIILAVGIVRRRIFDREILFFTLAAIFMTLYALGKFTPFFQLAYLTPGADFFRRPADAAFPLCALIAIVAGYLLHCRIEHDGKQSARELLLSILLALLALMSCVYIAWAKGRLGQAIVPIAWAMAAFAGAGLVLWAVRRWWLSMNFALVIVAVAMTADLAFNNAPNESTGLRPAEYEVLRPDSPNRTVAVLMNLLQDKAAPDRRDRVEMPAVGFAWPDMPLIHGFDHSLGYNPLILGWYARATGAIDHVAIPDQRKFSPLFADYNSPMLNLLGVRYIASGVPLSEINKSFKSGDLEQVGRTNDAYIYENPRALPRVVIATQALPVNFEAMIGDGKWPDVDFRRTALLEAGDAPAGVSEEGLPPTTRARIRSYRNTEVVVEAETNVAGWLVLHDTWHPWWKVRVDGAPAKLLRANVIFRAVAIPAGRHIVTFSFHPFEGLLESEPLAGVVARFRAAGLLKPNQN